MTKKRFTFDIDQENGHDEEPYFCNGTDSFYVNNADEMELFLKEINELVEKNEQLKQDYDKFAKFIRRNHAVGMIHRILKGDDVE